MYACILVQDDILLPTLTVRENKRYAADLRLTITNNTAREEHVVKNTSSELGLKECADTKIGNSSNSQWQWRREEEDIDWRPTSFRSLGFFFCSVMTHHW